MNLLHEGKETIFDSVNLVESLDSYTSYFEVVSSIPIPDKGYSISDGSNDLPLTLVSITKQENSLISIFEPTITQ